MIMITIKLNELVIPKTRMITQKLRQSILTMILNLLLTSSLIVLAMLILTNRTSNMLDLLNFKFENSSQVHFYGKEDPTTVDVDSLCRNAETHRTSKVSVWKTTLDSMQRWTPSDLDVAYHAYIVYETEDPMGVKHYWSQEKLRDRLVLQHSTNKEDVIKKVNGAKRVKAGAWRTEPEPLLQDYSVLGAVPQWSLLS